MLATAALCVLAGCSRFDKAEPVAVPGVDGASLANANAYAADAPALPTGYLDVDEFVEDGVLAPMRNADTIPHGVRVTNGIVYGRDGEYDLVLDLYQPEQVDAPAPALVFIHGGGWARHGRDYYAFWASRYASMGYVCVSIDYRISEEAPFPAAVEDAKCAVRWVRAKADELQIDPNRIAVIGQSAGAHLALMVAYSPDVPELEGDGGHEDYRSGVRAVVNFYGPTDLTTPLLSHRKSVKKFMGGRSQEDAPDQYAAASPMRYLTSDDPPTLIFHGTADDVVAVEQSDRLAFALAELGIPYVYDRQEGWNHAMDILGPINERCLYIMDHFLDEHLGPEK
ncbi:MAG: hypothetical protein AMXMBFR82_22200 [Candidatus Hydrogenedentota bacterium]